MASLPGDYITRLPLSQDEQVRLRVEAKRRGMGMERMITQLVRGERTRTERAA